MREGLGLIPARLSAADTKG